MIHHGRRRGLWTCESAVWIGLKLQALSDLSLSSKIIRLSRESARSGLFWPGVKIIGMNRIPLLVWVFQLRTSKFPRIWTRIRTFRFCSYGRPLPSSLKERQSNVWTLSKRVHLRDVFLECSLEICVIPKQRTPQLSLRCVSMLVSKLFETTQWKKCIAKHLKVRELLYADGQEKIDNEEHSQIKPKKRKTLFA